MIYSAPFLTRMAVARAIAHPADDLTTISKQILNMTQRNLWLHPVKDKDAPGKPAASLYSPADCIVAAVVLRLWAAGFSASTTFDSAVNRLGHWYLSDTAPDWKEGDPIPDPNLDQPSSPAAFILQDFCETGAGWTLRVDHRRHNVTGESRVISTLWRDDGTGGAALGTGSPLKEGESPQSAHIVVLDEILAKVAASTIYRKRMH